MPASRLFALPMLVSAVLCSSAAGPNPQQTELQLSRLISELRNTQDIAEKDRLLQRIIREYPTAASELLVLGRTTDDPDTQWLAIRGLGMLKYQPAAPFLLESLASPHRYVRSNAARALAELQFSAAKPALIHMLGAEEEGTVIEQTSLALAMLNAVEAIPTLKAAMSHPSLQTRCWLLDAIGRLGSKDDLPFMARYLYDSGSPGLPVTACVVASCAARAMEPLTGQDFGFPKWNGPLDPCQPVEKARQWWEAQ